jgi:hypothetical protein
MRWLFAAFLIAHSLVHIAVWTSQRVAVEQGTTPDHSWLLGTQHAAVAAMTYVTVALFALAGGALVFQAEIWRELTVVAAAVSLLLVALFPEGIAGAWVVAPVAIDVGLIAGIVWLDWPSKAMVGV